jgi:hypothetical protein
MAGSVLLAGLLAITQSLACAQSIHIGNADTDLQVTAGDHAPRMQRLTVRQSGGWQGQLPERFIDHVTTVNGQRRELSWHFNRAASMHNAALLRLTYEAADPHLRLSWEWHARAAHGPLEHSIRITNLSRSELWLPLEDSLQYSWRVAADEPLQQLWVEKGAGKPSPT